MSETSGAVTTSGVVILEEPEVGGASGGRQGGERAGVFRCAFWPRQQTWLCVVPLLIGFVGLGLSLMLLKWIVVGSVQDYVPTDLVDAKGIGQDPIFLSKPSALPKGPDSTTSSTTTTTIISTISTITTAVRGKTRTAAPPNANPKDGGSSGSQVTQKTTTTTASGVAFPGRTSTSSPSSSKPTVLNDSTREHSTTERPANTPARTHVSRKTHSSCCLSSPSRLLISQRDNRLGLKYDESLAFLGNMGYGTTTGYESCHHGIRVMAPQHHGIQVTAPCHPGHGTKLFEIGQIL
ncbi:hypothetical protein QTP86_006983 [Hemibagrus guttatus]|nr:hypothetical protein QTP86_006983 [Hemibagrus guttatus]